MARGRSGVAGSFTRAIDRAFERLSARPLSLLVFAGSIALLVFLESTNAGRFHAQAVTRAPVEEHPALVASFVEAVYALPGDQVAAGSPLLDLSSHFIDRELARIDLEIEQVVHESRLARARLLVDEERWIAPGLRRQPNRPSLERPTEELYAAQLERLHARRALLAEDQRKLTIVSRAGGRVSRIMTPGSAVAIGTSVATVLPGSAREIVAYLPSGTDPALVSPGTRVTLAGTSLPCASAARVLRPGAAVEEAPSQLTNWFRFPVFGLPVYISVPEGCDLGVGQTLSVEFARADG